jgi:HlyD family secretion protein
VISKKQKTYFLVILLFIVLTILALTWFYYIRIPPLTGIVSGNGRLEATQIDIATKFQGRVAEILFDEGDMVKAGEIVARIDTESLEARLREAQAMVNKAEKERAYAAALLSQRESECDLKKKKLQRYERLYKDGIISLDKLDEARTEVEISIAACDAAKALIANAEASIKSAKAVTERLKSDIEDCILKAPRDSRVQYRLAEPGEVLPSGGKILTTIDLDDIYMTIFLPEVEAGKVRIGTDARITLDAFPNRAFAANVSFIASKAQFTPKEVETRTERQKLSFRVKINLVNGDDLPAKPGMPGNAYVRIDNSTNWPEHLK